MGSVYKALYPRFNEPRALKVLNAALARDAMFVKRLESEAVLARWPQHANIVRVDHIDEAEGGRPFIVMEYIEGRSRSELIRAEAPLAASRVTAIVKPCA
jgi:serine/threonine-protein kinase